MKAIVLGALEGSGNIGEAIGWHLEERGWTVHTDDCYLKWGDEYAIPPLRDHDDAEAIVVTLGKTSLTPFAEQDGQALSDILEANLLLPLEAALEYVQVRGDQGGKIVFIGSYAHRHPFSNGTAYCAAKAGLEMATKTLGWELTRDGFLTYIVHPYHVEGTPMWEEVQAGVMRTKGFDRDQADQYARKDLLLKDPLSPAAVAYHVGRLLNHHEHNSWLSGSSLELFGGTR